MINNLTESCSQNSNFSNASRWNDKILIFIKIYTIFRDLKLFRDLNLLF